MTRPLLGLFLDPSAAVLPEAQEIARLADDAGLDLIGVQDHPYQRRFLDTFQLIALLMGQTSRVRFFPDVACLPLRPPPMLAKWSASLDVMSQGRFELGLGAGGFWDAIEAMGGPRRTPSQAVAATEEAIEFMREAWALDGGGFRFQGRFYQATGYKPGPPPAHQLQIWIGASGPRMMNLTGRLADGWVGSRGRISPEKTMLLHTQIDEGAESAGRDPRQISRIYNIWGRITDTELDPPDVGPTAMWVEALTEHVLEHRFDVLLFGGAGDSVAQAARFAHEVAPAVTEAVAAAAGGRPEND